MLRSEMGKQNITSFQLLERLESLGVKEDECDLRKKVGYGKLTAVYMLQCLEQCSTRLNQFCFPDGEAIRQERRDGRWGSIVRAARRTGCPPAGNPPGRVNSGQILRSPARPMHHIDHRRSPRPWPEFPPAERFNLVEHCSSRAWIAAVAFGLVFSATSAWYGWRELDAYRLKHVEQRDHVSTYDAEEAEQGLKVCIAESEAGFIDVLVCLANRADANRNAKRSQYDLEAQQDMARWALGLLLTSFPGLIISAVGLSALFWSLAQTRTAIRDAREIGEAQVRAYLMQPNIRLEVRLARPPEQPNCSLAIWVRIENSGNSPAGRVRYKIKASVNYQDGRPHFVWREVKGMAENEIASGLGRDPPPIYEFEEEVDCAPLEAVADDVACFRIDGVIEYDTVFVGLGGRTPFAFEGRAEKPVNRDLTALPIKWTNVCNERST
ncbi:MAG: DUF6471 domain-containing protein [Rhizobiaceae bacterium]